MRQHPQPLHWSILMLLVAVICLAPTREACAQDFVTGAFLGQIVDSNGNPIPGVTVRVVNNETGIPAARQTGPDGKYRLSQLQPADYTITISKDGFTTQRLQRTLHTLKTTDVIPPITLVAESVAAAAAPAPAESPAPAPANTQQSKPSEKVVGGPVSSGNIASEMSVTDARRDGTYTEKEVSTLPLGSTTLTRTFDELGLLLPGVALPPQTQGSVAGPGVGAGVGSAGQFAVNGLRSRANNFTVDGSDNNDEDIGVRRQGFFALVPQPIESIREFQMINLLAPAQYGRNMAAQVNAVSRSGGNDYHGAVYGFFNASQLNAPGAFDTTSGNTTLALQGTRFGIVKNVLIDNRQAFVTNDAGTENSSTLVQGGLVLGGPLVPGDPARPYRSLYFFLAAEGQWQHATEEASFAVPTVSQRGIFETGISGLTTADGLVFPTRVMGDAVFSLFPFPNNPSGVYGTNTYTQALPNNAEGRVFSGKVNGNFKAFGRGHELVARYNFTDDWRDVPVTGGGIFSSLRPRVRTQNFSTFLNTELGNSAANQLRLSYGRTRLNFQERRDPSLLASQQSPNTPFLLNRPLLANETLPGAASVRYTTLGTTERGDDPIDPFFVGTGPLGQVVISGFSPVGVDVFNFPQRRVNNTYQLADTVSLQRGRHTLILGADTRRTELNSELPRNARPVAVFGGAPDLPEAVFPLSPTDLAAAGSPTGFFSTLATDDSTIHLRYYQLNFFGQDEWRISPNLTLSFGVRYEYNTVPHEQDNRIERTFNAPELSLLPDLQTFIDGRTQIYDPDRNNIGPRVGLAYSKDFFAGKQTVIRAGYGLYYDQILGSVISQSRNVYPTFLTLNTAGGATSLPSPIRDFLLFNPNYSFTNVFGTSCAQLDFTCYVVPNSLNTRNHSLEDIVTFNRDARVGGFGLTLPERDLETPMAHQYSASFEQQLSNGLVVSAAYVGTLGRKLLRPTTPNLGPNVILIPQLVVADGDQPAVFGVVRAPGNQPRRPFPTAGSVNIFTDDARSRYDSLQVQLRGRFVRRLQFQANYTFSNAQDDASDVFDLAGSFALPQNSLTPSGEYADSSFDARHRIAYNFIFELPRFQNNAAQAIFGNLQIAGTGQFQTGQPFTVNSIFDRNLDGNLTDRLNTTDGLIFTDDRRNPLQRPTDNPEVLAGLFLAPLGQDGQVPRNSFRASNYFVNNAAVIKTFPVSESTRIVFRAEVFNIFNRANYGIPVRFLEAPGFGRSTETITPGRRIQFALKVLF
ncbi:MAG TPA: carboxypeptidase regulatory-like domain-containing protein [Pyrinomonadaceae bacterium]|nr:carboxypeptidase regulatory-like domain-containing protein [Pyrinomonadaceae bacterium]